MPSKKHTKNFIFELFKIYRIQRFFLVAIGCVFSGAGLALYFERSHADANILDYPTSLWWAVATATNTGYGDHVPVSLGGRVVAAGLMLVGMAMLSTAIALVASYFSHRRMLRDTKKVDQRLENIEESLAKLESKIDYLVINSSDAQNSILNTSLKDS